MIRKHPRFSRLSIKRLSRTVREHLVRLVDERDYTITQAVDQGLRLLYEQEYPDERPATKEASGNTVE